MKKKILLSIFVLMLTCFISLGAVGCDSSRYALTVANPGDATNAAFKFDQYQPKNSSEQNDSYYDQMEKLIKAGLKDDAFAAIELKYVDNTQEDSAKKETTYDTYAKFKAAGGKISGLNLRADPGFYQLTFVLNNVESDPVWYEITDGSKKTETITKHDFEGTDEAKCSKEGCGQPKSDTTVHN